MSWDRTIDRVDRERAEARRRKALEQALQRTDRILTGEAALKLKMVKTWEGWGSHPHISGLEINFSAGEGDQMIHSALAANWHALAHRMFSPSRSKSWESEIRQIEQAHDSIGAWNLFECQRVETLFSQRWGSAAAHFTRETLMSLPSDETDYLYVAGRRFIPAEVRQGLRAFSDIADLDRFDQAVTDWLLADPTSFTDYLSAFNALCACLTGKTLGTSPRPQDGSPDPEMLEDAQESLADQIAAEETGLEGLDPEEGSPEAGETEEGEEGSSEAGEAGEGEEGSSETGEGEEGSSEAGETEEGEEGSSETGEGEEGSSETGEAGEGEEGSREAGEAEEGAGGGDGASAGKTAAQGAGDGIDAAVSRALREATRQIRAEERETVEAIEAELERLEYAPGERFPRLEARSVVTAEARSMASELEGVLSELRSMVDPGWVTHQASGRISARRFLQGADLDEVFDRWDEGAEEAVDIEVAVLYDTSGSMGGSPAEEVAEAAWALKHALDRHSIPASVLTFASGSQAVYMPHEAADPDFAPSPVAAGGTQPVSAFREVGAWFAEERSLRRILVCLTDGQWHGDPSTYRKLLAQVPAERKVLLQYERHGSFRSPEGFDVVKKVETGSALVEAVRESIVEGAREWLRGR